MKIKITIVFVIIASLLIFFIFKNNNNLFVTKQVSESEEKKMLTKNEFINFILTNKFVDYSNTDKNIEADLVNSADVITIHFWASWCAPCVNEVPDLIKFAQKYSTKNSKNLKLVFITVSLDEENSDLNKFIKSFPEFDMNPFIRVWDKDKNFSKFVNADRLPMTVILNKEIKDPRIVRGVVEWKNIQF